MSDKELLRLLDSRAGGTYDVIRQKRARHLELMTEAYALEEEIVDLGNVLGSLQAAMRDLRNGGSRKDAKPVGAGS